jgi:hypothetical protein
MTQPRSGAHHTEQWHYRIQIQLCSNSMIRGFETGSSQLGHRPSLMFREQPLMDPVIERLAQALIRADDFDGIYGQHYTDGVGLALVARLLSGSPTASLRPGHVLYWACQSGG